MISKFFKFTGFKFLLSFVVIWIILLIAIPNFFDVEVDTTFSGGLALYALLLAFLVLLYRKGYAHQGHFALLIGVALIFGGLLAFIGSLGSEGINPLTGEPFSTEKYWILDARTQGFSLVGIGVGFIFLLFGIKLVFQNVYFWGNITGRRR